MASYSNFARLERLPQELFLEICEHLLQCKHLLQSSSCDTCPSLDLRNLLLCSKRMQQLVTPLLYSEITEIDSTKRLPLLLRTIVEKPALAQYVRSYEGWSSLHNSTFHALEGERFVNLRYSPCMIDLKHRTLDVTQWSSHNKSAIRNAMDNAAKSLNLAYYAYPKRPDEAFVDRWAKAIFSPGCTRNHSTWDATVALLLCLLPNLETMRIKSWDDDRQHRRDGVAGFKFILRVLDSSSGSGARLVLPKLHTVHLGFINCVYRKRLQRSLTRYLAPLKSFHYEAYAPVCTWKPGSRRAREIELGLADLRRRLFSHLKDDLEELSVVVRRIAMLKVTFSAGQPPEWINGINSSWNFGTSLSDFPKLRILRTTAQLLLQSPTVMVSQVSSWHMYNSSFEEAYQTAVYFPQQEQLFYKSLPKVIETLIILDCPNAMYGCIKRFLQSSRVPPSLKRIELAYTFPALSSVSTDRVLTAMNRWMANLDSEWSLKFPGEEFATKGQLEDLARLHGITLIQRIDENYYGPNN